MIQPWIMKLAIDDIGTEQFSERIVFYIAGILGVTVLVSCFRFLMRWLIVGVSRYVEHDIRQAVFRHVLTLPRTWYDSVSTGDIMSRMTNDIQRVRMILGPALMQIGNTFFSLLFALSFMFMIDAKLTLLSLLPLPLMPYMFYKMGKKIRFHSEKVQKQIADITSCAQENLTGIRVVKAYGLEQVESEKLNVLSDGYVKRNLNLVRVQGMFVPLAMLLTGLSTTVVLLLCGWWVIADRITIGSMVAFLEYLAILSWPMFAIGWVTGLVQQGSAAMQRIQDVLNEKPCRGMLPEAMEKMDGRINLAGDISFENVCFRYHPEQADILHNLDITITKGSVVAVMGTSGAGKSTIMHLLTGSYLPDSGNIRFNGHNTRDVPEYVIRDSVGIVPQNIVLFSDTIQSNLAFGSKNGDASDYEKTLRLVNLDREISDFPDKLKTHLNERGVNISGGQKQRLTLARMLVRNPDVILLDDPFSSVDIVTEEAVLNNLLSEQSDKTVLMATHRVNTAKRADKIIILDNGKIIEQGTHQELYVNRGYYYRLCLKQSLMDELETL
jgi:ATP-binding cassette, subfamily B, multidrug efflux pump